MLVWINGAFGAGKTQTAFELHRRLPDSHVADPELIGYGIHRMLPPAARNDFQDRPQWRTAVAATLADAVDATRTLAAQEFEAQLQGLLEAATKLGLSPRDVVGRVEDALSNQPDASRPTKSKRGIPE